MAAGFGIRHYLFMFFLLSIIFCISARNSISISGDKMTMLQVQIRRSLLSVQLEDYGAPSANRNHYPGKPIFNRGRGRGHKNRS
ncbi:protein PSY1 [Solanum dulcamara]|uniref:protein PSY1 n=1 Tax=Solanum dulcamara TaxID=45834 RepID=UPI002485B380|nr:protein PSY1 [Solanum dulcamara]